MRSRTHGIAYYGEAWRGICTGIGNGIGIGIGVGVKIYVYIYIYIYRNRL